MNASLPTSLLYRSPTVRRALGGTALCIALCLATSAQSAERHERSPAERRPEVVRQWSSRYHPICPLSRQGLSPQRPALISMDSPAEWASALPDADVQTVTGRDVRWSRERVILYAPAAGRTLTELAGPPNGLWLSHGSLYWPVQERAGPTAPHKGDRSCLVSVVSRAYWMRIKVIDPALIQRR